MAFAEYNGAKDLGKWHIMTGTTTQKDHQTADESNGAAMGSLAVEQEKDTKIVQNDSEKEYVLPIGENIGQVSKQDLNERDSSEQYEPEHIEQEYYAGAFGFTPPQVQYSFDQEENNNAEPNAGVNRDESNEPHNCTNAVPIYSVDLNASPGNGNQDQKLNSSIEVVSVIPAEIQVVAVIPGRPNVASVGREDPNVELQPRNGGETEQDPQNVIMENGQDLGGNEQDLNGSIEFVAEIPPEVQIVAEVRARRYGPVNGSNDILAKIANR